MEECILCGGNSERDNDFVTCETCGKYFKNSDANASLEKLAPYKRINLIQQIIAFNAERITPTYVPGTAYKLHYDRSIHPDTLFYIGLDSPRINQPILHSEKPLALLRMFCEKMKDQGPFDVLKRTNREFYSVAIDPEKEANEWLMLLIERGWLAGEYKKGATDFVFGDITISALGWEVYEREFGSIQSRDVFIAMDFNLPDRQNIQEAIKRACAANKFEAQTIDEHQSTGSIPDEMLAKIHHSRFMVAEFTNQNRGVYFEAGYAMGRKIPVIWTVKKEEMANIHFDINHFNHITWGTLAELEEKLKNRIAAVILA